jgi:hypothetical protein
MGLAPSGTGNSPEERAACLARARALYSEADIQAFLADSPGDECRLLTGALAPTPGALAGDPWTAARDAKTPGWDIPTDPLLRAQYFATHSPTVPLPSPPAVALVAPLAASLPPVTTTVMTAPIGGGPAGNAVSTALVPSTSPAPALAGLADNKLLLLALAVGAYLVFVRR